MIWFSLPAVFLWQKMPTVVCASNFLWPFCRNGFVRLHASQSVHIALSVRCVCLDNGIVNASSGIPRTRALISAPWFPLGRGLELSKHRSRRWIYPANHCGLFILAVLSLFWEGFCVELSGRAHEHEPVWTRNVFSIACSV